MAMIRILLYAFILAILSQVYHAIERLHFDMISQANLNADNRVFSQWPYLQRVNDLAFLCKYQSWFIFLICSLISLPCKQALLINII